MNTEQTISIPEIKKLLPEQAKITTQRKKGQVGQYLEIEVKIVPSVRDQHDQIIKGLRDYLGEDLIESYTEEEGHWFYLYIRMSSTVPTTVLF